MRRPVSLSIVALAACASVCAFWAAGDGRDAAGER